MLDDFEVGGDGVFHRTYLNWSRQMKKRTTRDLSNMIT